MIASALMALGAAGCSGDSPSYKSDLNMGPLVWPLSRSSRSAPLSSTFGPRIRNSTGDYDFHRGLDMPVPEGTRVYAAAAGVVRIAGDHPDFSEPVVQLAHCDDAAPPSDISDCESVVYTVYQHLQRAQVSAGDRVSAGELIGRSGAPASGTPHLHFEIRYGSYWQRSAIHPLEFLPHVDTGAPELTLDRVTFNDPTNPRVYITVRRPAAELDLVRVEAEVRSARTGELMSSQSYDMNEWNDMYTPENEPNRYLDSPTFNGVTVAPERFNSSSSEYVVSFRFRNLSSTVDPSQVHVVVRAVDVHGNVAEDGCNPCTE